jgi:hypothetical protein
MSNSLRPIARGANKGQTLKHSAIIYFTYLGWLKIEMAKTPLIQLNTN